MSNLRAWNRRRRVTAGLLAAITAVAIAVPWKVVAQQPPAAATRPSHVAVPATATTITVEGNARLHLPRNADGKGVVLAAGSVTAEPAASATTRPETESFNAAALGTISVPMANIRSLTSGTVARVLCREGQQFKKGELMVELESGARADAVNFAAAILKTSQERHSQLESHYKAGLAADLDVSQAQLEVDKARDTLRQRQGELDQARITAPFDGTVSAVSASAGSTVLPGDPIVIFIAVNDLTVEASVPALDGQWLKPGMPVLIRSQQEDELGRASITAVDPVIDSAAGTRHFHAKMTSTTGPLFSGECVTVGYHTGK